MNLLARNVYALMQNQPMSESDTLTTTELSSLQQLAEFRLASHAPEWAEMSQAGWYPVIDQLDTEATTEE